MKRLRELKREFPDWEILPGRKHIRMKHVSGAVYYVPSTPSDGRAWANMKAGIKRLLRRQPCSTQSS